jgi:dTDP-4-dehydrorhamnose 3,5-epimerase
MPFSVERLPIPGVLLVRAGVHADDRGWFTEVYKTSALAAAGLAERFVQDNASWSERRGTLRGLHLQVPPAAQGKLVRCLRGAIFDVVVDLRRGSPTEGTWRSFELTAASGDTIWVPAGLAHGFQTLVDDSLVLYKTTEEYSPAHEVGIHWDDPDLEIPWPVRPPILSPRDASLPRVSESGISFEWSGR